MQCTSALTINIQLANGVRHARLHLVRRLVDESGSYVRGTRTAIAEGLFCLFVSGEQLR